MAGPKRIRNRGELMALAAELGVRQDWHEPDNQGVTAEVRGKTFDNAGFWGAEHEAQWMERYGDPAGIEKWVILVRDGEPVAEVNLAELFAWATGYEADASPRDEVVHSALAMGRELREVRKMISAAVKRLEDTTR